MAITPIFTTVYHLDPEKKAPDSKEIQSDESLIEYVQALVSSLFDETSARHYAFPAPTVQLRQEIGFLARNENRSEAALRIAERLHREEKAAQEKVKHIVNLQRGSLLICLFDNDDGTGHIILAKIDHSEFLGLERFKKSVGLPFKKQALKVAMGTLSNDGQIDSMSLADTNGRISEYWWKNFLELQPVREDGENTKSAFNLLDKALINAVKKKGFKNDYLRMWNSLVRYFRGEKDFDFDGVKKAVVESHVKADSQLDLGKVAEAFKKISEEGKIDKSFGIDLSPIRSRVKFKQVISLTNEIDLHLKASYNHATDIKPFQRDGVKGIEIVTDEGYQYFKNPTSSTDD